MSTVTATILKKGKALDPAFQVVMIDVYREMNKIPGARITLIDGTPAQQKFIIADSDFFEPGSEIEIKLRFEEKSAKDITVFKGLVVSQVISADPEGFLLSVELKHKVFALTTQRSNSVFPDTTDYKVVSDLLKTSGVKVSGSLGTNYQHPQLIKYSCSDWDFAVSRTDANGGAIVVLDDEIKLSPLKSLQAGGAKGKVTVGIDEVYSFELKADASGQLAKVSSTAWDSKDQILRAVKEAPAYDPGFKTLKGDALAKSLGITKDYNLLNTGDVDENETIAWGNAKLVKSRISMYCGRIRVRGRGDITSGDTVTLAGLGKRFDGKVLVSGVFHDVDANGWITTLQLGISPDWFTQSAPHVSEAPAFGLMPAIHGLQVGVVEKFEKDPGSNFRIQVKVPAFYAEKDAIIWARFAMPYAGAERGFFFFPEKGDEVILGFLNDDPRQAVILGSIYSSKNTLPKDYALDDKNLSKGIIMKNGAQLHFKDDAKSIVEIKTPEKSSVVIDDNKKSIVITDASKNVIELSDKGITLKSAKDLMLEASGNVTIKGSKVDVQ